MKHKINSWFTLIELLVAITIFFIISVIAFAPYWFYMNKEKVKFTNKELSQVIYEAKNMAINGSAYLTWNISVWVYLSNEENIKNSYNLLAFDHDVLASQITADNGRLIQKHILQPGIQIDNFDGDADKGIIFFRSITGSGLVLKWDNFWILTNQEENNIVTVEYSYKGSSNPLLKNSLEYFQDTQIVDY